MDIRQLQYFVRIADEGSITGAARSLHMSQPPLSMQMKLLEEELGVTLFDRGSRTIRLTDAGKLLYNRAQGILELSGATVRELKDFGNGLERCVWASFPRRAPGRLGGGCGAFLKSIPRCAMKYPRETPMNCWRCCGRGGLRWHWPGRRFLRRDFPVSIWRQSR